MFCEGAIKLTLGKTHQVIYAMENDGSDIIIPSYSGKIDLRIELALKRYRVDFKQANKINTKSGELDLTSNIDVVG